MTFIDFAILFALAVISISFLLLFYRFLKGPTLEDRIISIDLLAVIGVGFIAAYSMLSGGTVFLDVAIILALLSFLGTVAFAYYLERRKKR
jgi:multicomponent Na+:H+ antiporter subunit F